MDESRWWASTDQNELIRFLNAADTGTFGRFLRRGIRGIEPLMARQTQLIGLADNRTLWKWLPRSHREWIVAAEDAVDASGAQPPIPVGLDEEWLLGRALPPHVEAYIQNRVELRRQGDAGAMESIHWIVASLIMQHEYLEQWHKDHPEVESSPTGAEVFLREQSIWQAHIVRDIVGNPFRTIEFDSRWRTDDVRQIAQRIHEECDYGTTPILADALQEAGCESVDILDHCRGAVPHTRGCWVIEAIRAK